MIAARRLALVALNLAFLGAVYAAWTYDGADVQVDAAPPVRRQAPDHVTTLADNTSGVDVSRSLFRSPPPAPVPAVEPSPEPTSQVPNFRLAGVVWSDSEKVAILQMTDDGGHRRLRVGETIGDWTLNDLSARTARVGAGDHQVELTLKAAGAQ
ncbi:hypothetical protein [Methylopila sp. M107]|uniref:hypothetical protein n=1 Tax=Methylopila sp. M107 TaxID=1101190 RepID=UPI000374D111|nr:hypothetical protein [Methylopila sp. M107]